MREERTPCALAEQLDGRDAISSEAENQEEEQIWGGGKETFL